MLVPNLESSRVNQTAWIIEHIIFLIAGEDGEVMGNKLVAHWHMQCWIHRWRIGPEFE